MTITPQFLDELRARIALSDVVGRKVSWHPGKSNPGRRDYWACCPFHQEDTPSFHADDRRGRYKCFGCGASGDVVTFVMETERLAFPEAVERLALEAGMEPPSNTPEDGKKAELRERLVRAQEVAVRFFRQELRRGEGRKAHDYLRVARGLAEATVDRFALGYAPREGGALVRFLNDNDVAADDALAAGLLIKPEDGGRPFARFRDRIMFPIRDGRGRVVAFGGRAMSERAQAKYLNSPETPVFSKGRLLYNLENARSALGAEGGALIVVEGYMDVIGLAQAGVENVVAPLGTAITEDQLETLWRATGDVVLAFDGDTAGARAAARALERALPRLAPDKLLRFAFLPDGQDPDDLARSGGARAVQAVLDRSLAVGDMLWRMEVERCGARSPEERAKLRGALRNALSKLSSADLKTAYGEAFRLKLDDLGRPRRDGAPGAKTQGSSGHLRPAAGSTATRVRPADRAAFHRAAALVVGGARAPDLVEAHLEAFASLEFASAALDEMREHLLSAIASESVDDVAAHMRRLCGSAWDRLCGDVERAVPWLQADRDLKDLRGGWIEALASVQRLGGGRFRRRTGV